MQTIGLSAISPHLEPASSPARALGRVLVVHDTLAKHYPVALALRGEGFDVVEVASGKAALEAAALHAPDAVVLDLNVPEQQSLDVCRRLKAASDTLLPILYLSSRTSRQARARALDAGFDGYLTHPFDSNELCAAVGALIRLKHQEAKRVAAATVGTLLADALDAIADHVALIGPDSKVIAVNRSWAQFAEENGYLEGGTGLGGSYSDICERALGKDGEEADAALKGLQQVLAGTLPSFQVDYPCHSPTEERWFRMVVRLVSAGGPVAAIVTHTNRTSEHLAAAAEASAVARLVASLETERSRLVTIFEEAPAFLAVLRGPDYVFERINPAYVQLVGHRDSVGLSLLEALPEIRGQGFIELLDAVRLTGVPFVGKQMPVQLARTPGAPLQTRYLDQVYKRLPDASGEFSIVAHGVDVTDQVLATEALRRSDQRLRDQFAKLPVPTFLWERSGDDFVLLDCNEAAMRAFPLLVAGGIGEKFRDRCPEFIAFTADFARCLADDVVIKCALEFDEGEGRGNRTLELTIGPQQPDRVLVHAVDNTGRLELESQLRQAQKMDAVGRLAGGVAHDFNNLLTVISAHSSFLLEALGAGDALREDAEAIHKAGIRAAGLTRQLLAFSRKQILKPTVLDLGAIVAETEKMLERLLGEDIEIVTDCAPELYPVVTDATQIEQVIVNLAVNARDAMPDGGTLTIATRNATVETSGQEERRSMPPGEYVLLEVTDTGVGMDDSVKARMFEPFFTTKQPGQGTGLGLATVYGIVKQSAGYVFVESALGQGTTFQVYLPAAINGGESDELRAAESVAVRGVETVLLIEDELALLQIAHRILKRQGYQVLLAASGAEALDASRAYRATIHLVISDAVMPGMSGAEVVKRLQEERPGLKVLFMSGYTDDEILRRGIVSSTTAFIQKPFTLAAFSLAAREALDG